MRAQLSDAERRAPAKRLFSKWNRTRMASYFDEWPEHNAPCVLWQRTWQPHCSGRLTRFATKFVAILLTSLSWPLLSEPVAGMNRSCPLYWLIQSWSDAFGRRVSDHSTAYRVNCVNFVKCTDSSKASNQVKSSSTDRPIGPNSAEFRTNSNAD